MNTAGQGMASQWGLIKHMPDNEKSVPLTEIGSTLSKLTQHKR